jgi:hypothetical protein
MRLLKKIRDFQKAGQYRARIQEFEKLGRDRWRTVARDIAPSHMKYRPTYVLCDDTLIRYILVGVTRHGTRGLPKKLTPDIVSDLQDVTLGNYTIGITSCVEPIPAPETNRMLNEAEDMNLGNRKVERDANKSTYVSADTRFDMDDINETIRAIHDKTDKLIGFAEIISIRAEDETSMRNAIGHVLQVLDNHGVRAEQPVGSTKDMLQTSMPFPFMPVYAQSESLSSTVATFLAITNTNSETDDRGLRYGDDMTTGDPIIVDLEKLPAMHHLFVGETGAGKTTAVLAYLQRLCTQLGFNVVLVTPKKDDLTNYRNVAASLGDDAEIIDIGPKADNINPLQIVYNAEYIGDHPYDWAAVVHNHVSLVVRFFTAFLEDGMTAPKRSYINESLIRLYKNCGIDVSHPETLKQSLAIGNFPCMNDLIELWKQDLDEAGHTARVQTIDSMISNTYQLSNTGSLAYMNQPSTISIDKEFTVVDVSGVPSEALDAMNVFVTGLMWQKFKNGRKSGKPTMIVIDEARVFLQDKTLMMQLTQARSEDVGIGFCIQQLADLTMHGVEDIVKTNVFVNVVFGPGGDAGKLSLVSKYFNLTDEEGTRWIQCNTGEAMLIVRGRKTPINITLTDYELAVIKGTEKTNIEDPEYQPPAIAFEIDERVRALVDDHDVCLDLWTSGDAGHYFNALGWQTHSTQDAFSAGKVRTWVKPGKIKNEHILNQTTDHYMTVLQIAGKLLLSGVSDVVVEHHDGVDVSAKIGDERIAFEYERPGSHTQDELTDKLLRAETNHGRCYFVGSTANEGLLKNAVGEHNVVKRGIGLKHLIDTLTNQSNQEI